MVEAHSDQSREEQGVQGGPAHVEFEFAAGAVAVLGDAVAVKDFAGAVEAAIHEPCIVVSCGGRKDRR